MSASHSEMKDFLFVRKNPGFRWLYSGNPMGFAVTHCQIHYSPDQIHWDPVLRSLSHSVGVAFLLGSQAPFGMCHRHAGRFRILRRLHLPLVHLDPRIRRQLHRYPQPSDPCSYFPHLRNSNHSLGYHLVTCCYHLSHWFPLRFRYRDHRLALTHLPQIHRSYFPCRRHPCLLHHPFLSLRRHRFLAVHRPLTVHHYYRSRRFQIRDSLDLLPTQARALPEGLDLLRQS